ncbi:MAG TPA: zinc-ribbon domain-containing protein [Nocardia sp.]|uniref:zinc-ribbon domain-containing protein n=1 Tax=Nocardia TaxID=1817 RepID=UPI0024555D29|nr:MULTISPECIES: zinc-ribbon domain-containing protein [Nocardia]HLS77842.1 zinc-ribbon domain-containing protein [Nocardia sp.]
MFFLFGFGRKREDLGPGATRTCPRCHNTTQWLRVREFSQVTVFFIPVARWGRKHLEVCGICGAAVELPAA